MRLFFAFAVPPRVRADVDRAVAPLRERHPGLSWTPAANWHLTAAFLGTVAQPPEAVLAAAAPAVAAPTPATVRLALGAAGRFGTNVLWLGVSDDPPGALAAIGDAVQEALAAAGLPVDRKPVRPHITLARGRKRPDLRVDRRLVAAVPVVEGTWSVDELLLVSSRLQGPRPARYETVGRLPLGSAPS